MKRKRPNHARGGLTPEVDMMALLEGLMDEEREIVQVDPGVECWIPAYFQEGLESESAKEAESGNESQSQQPVVDDKEEVVTDEVGSSSSDARRHSVVDPTGGGNAFLGGLAVALARGKEIVEAATWGSVAASLAIEQVGMPVVGSDESGRETWNGVMVDGRLKEFVERCERDREVGS